MLKEKLRKNYQNEFDDEDEKLCSQEEEKIKYDRDDFEDMRRKFDDERSQYLKERMEFEATQALSREGLPTTFAKLVKGKDSKETAQNVAEFKEEFFKEVEKAAMERMRGQTPKTGVPQKDSDPFLGGFLKQ